MKDVNTAIVLAAGASRRMGSMTAEQPKSLLPYRGGTILERLIGQLRRHGIEHVVVVTGYQKDKVRALLGDSVTLVENDRYAEDTNLWSMHLALQEVHGSVTIFEADTIMEDAMVRYATGTDFERRSAWFTRGPFTSDQYGGIVRSDERGRVVGVRVVPAWQPELAGWSKMTGVMRVGRGELPRFRALVEEYAARSIAQYFFAPWTDHLEELPSVEGDARHYAFQTFNTPDEYARVLERDFDPPPARGARIEMIETARLRHIEGFDEERVLLLKDKIVGEGVWTKPLYVERSHALVLDGQHRLQVALRLGLPKVPVQAFDYGDVAVWTLRKEEKVDVPTVIARATAGDVYPYKTVKHKFPNVIDDCAIPLAELGYAR